MIPSDFEPHRRLSGRSEARTVLDETILQTRRHLRVFDDRGVYYGFERRAFALALNSHLSAHRDALVTIVVHDTEHIAKFCPRLLDLLHRHAPRLMILRTDDTLHSLSRGLVVADHGVLLSRPNFAQSATFVDYDDMAVAEATSLFLEIEKNSSIAMSGRVTGL